jgi:hypothetical protein
MQMQTRRAELGAGTTFFSAIYSLCLVTLVISLNFSYLVWFIVKHLFFDMRCLFYLLVTFKHLLMINGLKFS